MTNRPNEEFEIRERQSRAVAAAVAKIVDNCGYPPEVVFEGAVRGACAALMLQGLSPAEVGQLLQNSGRIVATLDQDR